MFKSSMAAFVTVVVCFALLQIPGKPQTASIQQSVAAPPQYEELPCPNGMCPAVRAVVTTPVRVVATVASAPVNVVRSVGHWSYPGNIHDHVMNDHGVNTAGMTAEQARTLHDQLHTSQNITTRVYTRPAVVTSYGNVRVMRTPVRTVMQTVRPLQRVGNVLRTTRNVVFFRRCR